MIGNKLSFNQHSDEMSKKKATCQLHLYHCNLHMCFEEANISACYMIVHPHLEYAATCWNHYTKNNTDKLETVQHRAARFVINFYDYHPTANLSGKIYKCLKCLKWDSMQQHRAVANQCIIIIIIMVIFKCYFSGELIALS